MSSVSIQKELSTYLPLLSERQQTLILDMVKNILHVDPKEKRISLEQYNTEIEAALKATKKGKGISHETVLEQSKRWLKENSYFLERGRLPSLSRTFSLPLRRVTQSCCNCW
jgi:hypothetical protein